MTKKKKMSGIYVVKLFNEELMPADIDSRREGTVIEVNKLNCKVGKTIDLNKRRKDYERVFGPENVCFCPVAELEEVDEAENHVLNRLEEYQVEGKTGISNEWLERITAEEVRDIILNVLDQNDFEYTELPNILKYKRKSVYIKRFQKRGREV